MVVIISPIISRPDRNNAWPRSTPSSAAGMRRCGEQRQVSFSELEWRAQGIRLEPSLQCLSDFLDLQGELLELVAGDSDLIQQRNMAEAFDDHLMQREGHAGISRKCVRIRCQYALIGVLSTNRGFSEQKIRDELLHARDLSKKGSPARQLGYAQRTATKALGAYVTDGRSPF